MAHIRYVPVLIALAVALGGCGDESPSTSPGSTVSQSEEPSSPPTPAPTPSTKPPTGPAALAVSDLATRLGETEAEIEVVRQEEVTWPDASLGCPKPGMMYAQVLTPGLRIVLSAGGKQYEYHSGGQRPPFYCENPQR
jgi:hypothetical protein